MNHILFACVSYSYTGSMFALYGHDCIWRPGKVVEL